MINELYCLIGEILENAQYIEWNLAVLICKSNRIKTTLNEEELFDSMQTSTMGQIIGDAEKINIFSDEDLTELKYILMKRNYLAHHFFKKNDIVKHQNNTGFLNNKICELRNILSRFQSFNQYLASIE